MNYEKAWNKLKEVIESMKIGNKNNNGWLEIITLTDLQTVMSRIESEVCNNDEQRKG